MHETGQELHVPPIISWVLTGVCNMRCLHCYPESGPDYTGPELGQADQLQAVSKFAEAGIESVYLSGGESLLVPHIFELVDAIHSHDMSTWICSNGSRIDGQVASRIADAGVGGVSISIDSANSAIHDSFRVHAGSFAKAVGAIRSLREQGVAVDVDFTATRFNRKGAGEVVALANQLGVRTVFLKRFRPIGRGSQNAEELSLSLDEYRQLGDELLEAVGACETRISTEDPALMAYFRRRGASIASEDSVYSMVGCFAGVIWLGVLPNGDVTPCPLLDVPIGNIVQDDLLTIIEHSDVLRRMLDRDDRGGQCGQCEERWQCGGCRAHAHAVTGDVFAEEPYCAFKTEVVSA